VKYLTIILVLCVGCARREPVAVFPLSTCAVAPTTETRTRRIQTTCALRSGSANPHNAAKICLMWNHSTIHERKEVLSCSRDQWSRYREP
jgi:hypothetical protein